MRRQPYPRRARMAVHADALALLWGQAPEVDAAELSGGIAILAIDGPLEQRGGWWWMGYDTIVEAAGAALAREEVWGLVLQINSPGGDVAGCFEATRQLRQLARDSGKPMVAAVDEEACSAAYCLASACDAIVVPPAGVVGSIGVLATVYDRTGLNEQAGLNVQVIGSGKYKGEFHPDRPLTADNLKRLQADVDELAGMFAQLVADHRPGLTAKGLLDLEAECFRGAAAVEAGLADEVGTVADALEACRRRIDAARTTNPTAARPSTTRTAMNREQQIKFLGLAANATDAEIADAWAALTVVHDQVKALAGSTTLAGAVGKLGASAARLDQLEADAKETAKKTKALTAEAEVGKLVAQKRLPPAQKAFALSIHGTASWPAYLESLPGGEPQRDDEDDDGATGRGQGASATGGKAQDDAGRPPPRRSGRGFDAQEQADITKAGLTAEAALAALDEHREQRRQRIDEEI